MVGACHGLVGAGRDTWRDWWEYNKDEYVWERRVRKRRAAPTASGPLLVERAVVTDLTRAPLERLPRAQVYTSVVPALLEVVRADDEDPRVLDAAARSLGVAVQPPFDGLVAESLEPLLEHAYDEVKVAALMALGLSSADHHELLLEFARGSRAAERLSDEDEIDTSLRTAALLALGYGDQPASVLPILGLLQDPREDDADVRRAAVHALGLMRNERASAGGDHLLRMLADERLDPRVRSAVPIALARLGRADALPRLAAALADRGTEPCVRQSVVIALGRLASMHPRHASFVDDLLALVEDDDDSPTRHFALMSLARLGAHDEHADLHEDRHAAIRSLLAQQLERPTRRAQDWPWFGLATGLYLHGQPAARAQLAPPLLRAYEEMRDPQDIGAFALGLGLADVAEAGPLLSRDLRRQSTKGFKGYLALGLGFLGYTDAAEPVLDELAEESRRGGFRDLTLAVLLMNDPQLNETMVTQVLERFDRDVDEGTRTELAGALEVLRRREVIAPLRRALQTGHLDELRRAWACAAMQRLAEDDELPWHARLTIDRNYMVRGRTFTALK